MNFDILVCDNEKMQEWKRGLNETDTAGEFKAFGNAYEGFQIFSDSVSSASVSYDHIFIMAVVEKTIIGVLKCSHSRLSTQEKIWSVSWVDVHRDYKRKGVARALYSRLNDWLDDSFILVGTPLEAEGKQANLYELRRSIITRCPNYDHAQVLWNERQ